MSEQIHIFFNALVFFTRLPCPEWVVHTPEYQRQAGIYAPLVGWIVGAIASLTLILAALILPLPVAVVLSMAVSVWVTGAFHEDGLGDVCDGFGGAWRADQIRTIMKDSCIGSYGAIALILVLLAKFVVLTEIGRLLPPLNDALIVLGLTLVSGHALSRLAAISLMFTHCYIGDNKMSNKMSKSAMIATPPGQGGLAFAVCCGLAPLVLFSGLELSAVWLALAPVVLVRWYLGRFFRRRLGGYTGDCLGAVQQLTEVVFYLAVCAVLAGQPALSESKSGPLSTAFHQQDLRIRSHYDLAVIDAAARSKGIAPDHVELHILHRAAGEVAFGITLKTHLADDLGTLTGIEHLARFSGRVSQIV